VSALLIAQVFNGIVIGTGYALVALGYYLTFGVLNVANLAYGEVVMAGAIITALCISALGFDAATAAITGIAGATVIGVLVHALAVAPLGAVEHADSPRHAAVLVSTIGASLIIQYAVVAAVGAYPEPFPRLTTGRVFDVYGISVPAIVVLNSAVVLVAAGGLALALRRTRFGVRLRAITSNRELALASGVRVTRDQFVCVALSSAGAGIAGLLVSSHTGVVSPFTGLPYSVKGLVAMIVGRTLGGTAAVAVALGIGEALTAGYWSSSYRDVLVYGLLVAFLAARPQPGVTLR
jgi:branched-chain amino acid transport system permease protein